MRYLIMLILISAILLGNNQTITFQGTINNANGSPYQGLITTGVDFFTAETGGNRAGWWSGPSVTSINIANGTYTIAINLPTASIDAFVTGNNNLTNPNQGYFMDIYVATGSVTAGVLFGTSSPNHRLTPRVQVLAVPMAFTSRGIYFNNTTTLRVGESFKTSTSTATNGMIVYGSVGIGTPTASTTAKLSVVAPAATISDPVPGDYTSTGNASCTVDNSRAIYINNKGQLNVTGIVTANKVYNARWQ